MMIKKLLKIAFVLLFGLFVQLNASAQCSNPHTTPWTFNNGQSGIMFAINAKKNIVIDSFDINWDPGTYGYQIYYKPGTFIGFDLIPGAWTLVGSGTATSTGGGGPTNLSASLNILLTTYSTGSFYITSTAGTVTNYTTGLAGTSPCDSLNGNSDLALTVGYGKAYPFGVTFTPRYFSGRVYYHCLPTPPTTLITPTLCNVAAGSTTQVYLTNPVTGATFTWTPPTGAVIVGNQNNDTITLQFTSSTVVGNVCVTMTDCGLNSFQICNPLQVAPIIVDAGPDSNICGSTYQMLPNGFFGVWTLVSGSGSITNPNQHNTTVTNLGQGPNTFKWLSDPPGCVADSDEVTITVNPIAVAQFTAPDGCAGTALNFSENSYALGGTIINREWDIDGDGIMDYSGPSFSHTYAAPSAYPCTLIVTASGGCTDTVIQNVIVHPNPVANFNNTPECEGSLMSFTDISSVSSGSITNWNWNFGDTKPNSLIQNPNHLYDSASYYLVTLSIITNEGCTHNYSDSIEVFSVPEPHFEVNDTCYNDTFQFRDFSTSVQGVINYWEYDFGDGSPKRYSADANYSYPSHSLYNATLTVATDKGCTNSVELPVKAYPVPAPDFSQVFECEKQEIRFAEDGSLNGLFGSQHDTWSWDFGDGATAVSRTPKHFYQNPGYYTVAVTAISNYGCDATIDKQILVRPKPEAQYLVVGDKVCADNMVSFSDQTYFDYTHDADGVTKWKWVFGDGTTSNKQAVNHLYTDGGIYQSTLVVSTQYGCIDSVSKPVTIYYNPTADYTIDTIENCSPHCAVFIDNSKIGGEEELYYDWSFGDGEKGDEVNPTHCYYAAEGSGSNSYLTRLRVSSEHGCWDTIRFDDPVIVNANPVASFTLQEERIGLIDSIIYLSNQSIGGKTYFWSFGDSNTSDAADPISHVYRQSGEYTVSLLVETAEGCQDQMQTKVNVEVHRVLFIPNAFTPNGDGINDFFTVKGEGLESTKIRIFDRWGTKIYSASNDDIKWDGTHKGEKVPNGSYAFVLEYKYVGETPQQMNGTFILSSTGTDF